MADRKIHSQNLTAVKIQKKPLNLLATFQQNRRFPITVARKKNLVENIKINSLVSNIPQSSE
jgi:hypothetical protein